MSSYIPSLDAPFASADFENVDETTHIEFDVGGHGQAAPYSLAINAVLQKHIDEIKEKNKVSFSNTLNLKRGIRDFMSKRNNELLDFLKESVTSHSVFGPGETILRRFGNPQVTSNHPSVRDMVMDVSGHIDLSNNIQNINEILNSVKGDSPLQEHISRVNLIYEVYKDVGKNALNIQTALKKKLDKLDKIQGKISGLFEIDTNEVFEPLIAATEEYLKKVYDESKIEQEYKSLISAYRQFILLREVIETSTAFSSKESEPMCSICLEESIVYAANPCGHTFCQTCMRKQMNSCFICRTTIKDKLRLYFA